MATPKVRDMATDAVHAGLLPAGVIEARLDEVAADVQRAYLENLDETERVKAEDFLQRAKDAAGTQWRRLRQGQDATSTLAPSANAGYAGPDELAPVRLPDVHDGGDAERDGTGRRLSTAHVQKELAKLDDMVRLRRLEAQLCAQSNWAQYDRLRELRHPEVSHSWLWHLDSRRGTILSEADYVANVQKRLGARMYTGAAPCRLCGAPLDPQLEHGELCSTAEATRGHYACVRSLVDGFRLADPNVATEPAGLTSTLDRPADIFTTAAVPGRSAALDVCIASPNAARAAGDAAASAFRRKLRRYRQAIPELARAGIVFRPLVWTADARPHPAAVRTLRYAASVAANRDTEADSPSLVLGRWRHEITTSIMRRRAAMLRAVLPQRTRYHRWMMTGRVGAPPSSEVRAPPLDEDEDCSDNTGAPAVPSERAPAEDVEMAGATMQPEDGYGDCAGGDVEMASAVDLASSDLREVAVAPT